MTRSSVHPHPVTTVLFDLDDTLINSFSSRAAALAEVFKQASLSHLDAGDVLHKGRGLEIRDILLHCGADRRVLDDLYHRYRRAYWTGLNRPVELFAGVEPVLHEMRARGLKLGVVTQKGREFDFEGCRAGAVVELEKAGILGLFSVVIGFEDVTRAKPHPEGIRMALDKLKSAAENTLYAGDSAADMQAASGARCRSCLATWGNSEPGDIAADFIAETPAKLLKITYG